MSCDATVLIVSVGCRVGGIAVRPAPPPFAKTLISRHWLMYVGARPAAATGIRPGSHFLHNAPLLNTLHGGVSATPCRLQAGASLKPLTVSFSTKDNGWPLENTPQNRLQLGNWKRVYEKPRNLIFSFVTT